MANETVYEHLKGNDTFTVSTDERAFISMLRKLKASRPDEVEIVSENKDGSILVHLPVSWMKIRPKRVSVMTEEQREAAGERLKKYRKGASADVNTEEETED